VSLLGFETAGRDPAQPDCDLLLPARCLGRAHGWAEVGLPSQPGAFREGLLGVFGELLWPDPGLHKSEQDWPSRSNNRRITALHGRLYVFFKPCLLIINNDCDMRCDYDGW